MTRRAVWGTAVAAMVPIVVLISRAVHGSWNAAGDDALIGLRTRDVGTAHTPLVGPYSRFGWNHPGPALFYALAAPYRLLGSHNTGLLVGAAIISGISLVAIAIVLFRARISPLVATFGLLLCVLLVRSMGASLLWEPWNAYVMVLPFLAFMLLIWLAAAGEDRALPFAAATASFMTQSHVSLAAEAIALLALAVGWLVAGSFTGAGRELAARRRLRRSLLLSLAVIVVMWIPPIVQQFRPHGGNLGALVRFWTESHPDTVGFATATRLLMPQFSIPAPWMTGSEHTDAFSGALTAARFSFPFALVVLVVASIVAWRRRDRVAMAACSVAVTSAIVAWISIARIVGVPLPYLVRWTWVVGTFAWLASGVALIPLASKQLSAPAQTWLARGLAAGAAAVLLGVGISASWASVPDAKASRAARALVDSAGDEIATLPQPIMVESVFGYIPAAIAGGVIGGAVEHGADARFPVIQEWQVGPDHVVDPAAARTVLVVAVDDDIARFARDPCYRLLADYNSLSTSERRRVAQLLATLRTVPKGDSTRFLAAHRDEFAETLKLMKRQFVADLFVRTNG